MEGGGGVHHHHRHHQQNQQHQQVLPFYHVPQQSRREKLRYPTTEIDFSPSPHLLPPHSASHNLFMSSSCSSTTPFSFPTPLNPNYSTTIATSTATTPVALFQQQQRHIFPYLQSGGGGVSLSLSSRYDNRNDGNDSIGDPIRTEGISRLAMVAPAPSGSLTGHSAVLKSSRFLRPVQQMLEEICSVGGCVSVGGLETCDFGLDGQSDSTSAINAGGGCGSSCSGGEGRLKSRLISMLDEVYRRYKLYLQQVQYVMMSFESVVGLGNTAPYTTLALKSMTKHFQCLKNAIADQLRFPDRSGVKEGHAKEQINRYGGVTSGLCFHGVVHASGSIGQANVWRPQRGLPERAVAVLKAWLFEHFLHPYPTDTDKHMLAKQTGLSRNQVSNWFINARVRLWKPLVEEIHSLEVRQACRLPDTNNNDVAKHQHHFPSASSEPNPSKLPMQNSGAGKNDDPPHKRFRNEYTELSNHIMEPMGITFNDFADHDRLGAGISIPNSGNAGISLTLGLHQNNGICLPGSLPLNVARRFGLEESSASYVMEGYEVQERQFSKDIDGQLLHDFVG